MGHAAIGVPRQIGSPDPTPHPESGRSGGLGLLLLTLCLQRFWKRGDEHGRRKRPAEHIARSGDPWRTNVDR
jgi:hypothetical protein